MIGYQMARLESDIMMAVLLKLKAKGIVGLSIHDGLLVEHGRVFETREIMNSVTKERLGFSIPSQTELLKPYEPERHRRFTILPSSSMEMSLMYKLHCELEYRDIHHLYWNTEMVTCKKHLSIDQDREIPHRRYLK
jgi:hypothetical protein